jgi:cytochrome c
MGEFMKKTLLVLGAAALALSMNAARADEALAKSAGCGTCHDVSKKKMGPAFKTVAADWKKNNVDTAKGVAATKAKHPDLKASDADLTKLVNWIRAM